MSGQKPKDEQNKDNNDQDAKQEKSSIWEKFQKDQAQSGSEEAQNANSGSDEFASDASTDNSHLLSDASHEELVQQLGDAEAKINDLNDKLLRKHAEMDNLRRRVERDIANAHKFGLEKFIKELLGFIDNLQRGIDALDQLEGENVGPVREGIELSLKELFGILAAQGVEIVNPLKEVFDPAFHEAVSTIADPDAKSGTVINVMQKGYVLNDRLIRPALVVVAS